ncbi:hypothetical protein C1645_755239 [Glomus cerebriforme]|uniref:Rhomboid-type serine protease n=1 Tax=Glomus cerebriforme TaxID=658196 RepID=A0A397TDP7_9GLOM|nr:hypothetical protein C1645_755239 [Glomus cerebriforme]
MAQKPQPSSWNNFFHRDQAYDTTYNNNNNAPMEEPTRLSYFHYKQEGGHADVEKSHSNPGDPSFWRTPGSEQANVAPSAPPPPESLYGENSERGEADNDEEYARRILREEQMRYSQASIRQPGNIRSSYPPGEAQNYYGESPVQVGGIQGPPNNNILYDPKLPKAYRDPHVQQQLNKKKFRRPYFTYLVTLIQTVILIYEFIYNQKETGSLIQTQPFNILIGPSVIPTLIRLGARFVPCMKLVPSVPPDTIFSCIDQSLPNVNAGKCSLEDICGLGGFNNGIPNQWFRFITPIFLHGGLVHFLFNTLFQVQTGRHVESDIGSLRYGIIYLGSGIFGFIFGANFSIGNLPSVGSSGSLFGVIGILLLDLLYNWKLVINPCWELTKLLCMVILTFLIGLLPLIDNFSHIGGFMMGILLGLVLMPTINFSKIRTRFNLLFRFIALPIAALLFFLLIRNFYNNDDPSKTCPWCKYLDCLPINDWCNMSAIQNTTTTNP